MTVRTTRATIPLRVPVFIFPVATEYATYADLPSSAEAGDTALVLTGGGAGAWTWVASVSSLALGMWLPTWIAIRITGYVLNGSGNPLRISAGLNGETKSTILARGWIENHTTSGTCTDGANAIRLQAGATAWGAGILEFNSVPTMSDGHIFSVLEADNVTAGATILNAAYNVGSGRSLDQFSWGGNGAANRCRFAAAATGNALGAGLYDQTAYDRIFVLRPVGTYETGALTAAQIYAWPAKESMTPPTDFSSPSASQFLNASAAGKVWAQSNGGGNNTELMVREIHTFFLANP